MIIMLSTQSMFHCVLLSELHNLLFPVHIIFTTFLIPIWFQTNKDCRELHFLVQLQDFLLSYASQTQATTNINVILLILPYIFILSANNFSRDKEGNCKILSIKSQWHLEQVSWVSSKAVEGYIVKNKWMIKGLEFTNGLRPVQSVKPVWNEMQSNMLDGVLILVQSAKVQNSLWIVGKTNHKQQMTRNITCPAFHEK